MNAYLDKIEENLAILDGLHIWSTLHFDSAQKRITVGDVIRKSFLDAFLLLKDEPSEAMTRFENLLITFEQKTRTASATILIVEAINKFEHLNARRVLQVYDELTCDIAPTSILADELSECPKALAILMEDSRWKNIMMTRVLS